MHEKFDWIADPTGLFCGSLQSCHGKRYMVVESVPGGGWDWVAWSDDGSGRCLHGRTETAGQAREAAEHCAAMMSAEPLIEYDDGFAALLHREPELTNSAWSIQDARPA